MSRDPSHARIIAFDAGCARASAAALADGELRAMGELPEGMGAAEGLVALAADVARSAGWELGDADLYAVTTGPGGFTGVRVAVAMARALALATGRGVVPLTYFEACDAALRVTGYSGQLLVIKDIRRGEVMWQWFTADGRAVGEPQRGSLPDLAADLVGTADLVGDEVALAGDGADLQVFESSLQVLPLPKEPFAALLGQAAVHRLGQGAAPLPGNAILPLYHRPPDARPQAGAALVGARMR